MRFLNLAQIENKTKQILDGENKADELSISQNNLFKKKCQLIDKTTCKYAVNLFGKMIFSSLITLFLRSERSVTNNNALFVVHCSL